MMRFADIDVLVGGLGPAGACAAAMAASDGARVLAIDRKARAGFPVQCAEFIPAMIGERTAGSARSRRQAIRAMTTTVEFGHTQHSDRFPGHMIDRATFDADLVDRAKHAGADCRFGTSLRRITADGAVVVATGEDGKDTEVVLRPRVIVGADGPRSPVGRAIGQRNREFVETRQSTVPLLRPFAATDIFLSAGIRGGYAWLFPKGAVANLGLGVTPAHRHALKPLLDDLHWRLIGEGRVGREILQHTGGVIPVGGMLDVVGRLDRIAVLLAGDAAGLTNPITGAGINAAVMSGERAGEAAAAMCGGNDGASGDYAEEIAALFGASIDRALKRRLALAQTYVDGVPDPADLKRAWIAFVDYWEAEQAA